MNRIRGEGKPRGQGGRENDLFGKNSRQKCHIFVWKNLCQELSGGIKRPPIVKNEFMKKRTRKAARSIEARNKRLRILDEHDTKGYFKDLAYLGRLSFLSQSTRDWIEVTMYELREKANDYEHLMGEFLINNKIEFIHQAPFVFRPRTIYFCDFFLPKQRIVIEIDGIYHKGEEQMKKDAQRDYAFKSIGIRVIRVFNEETKDFENLKLRLSEHINF